MHIDSRAGYGWKNVSRPQFGFRPFHGVRCKSFKFYHSLALLFVGTQFEMHSFVSKRSTKIIAASLPWVSVAKG